MEAINCLKKILTTFFFLPCLLILLFINYSGVVD